MRLVCYSPACSSQLQREVEVIPALHRLVLVSDVVSESQPFPKSIWIFVTATVLPSRVERPLGFGNEKMQRFLAPWLEEISSIRWFLPMTSGSKLGHVCHVGHCSF